MTGQELAPIVAAAAAVVAAALTGINLYLSGKRQHVSWTRQALEKSCVDFLTAHYEHWDSCAALEALADGSRSHQGESELRESLLDSDRTMRQCITRFRVLTSQALVTSALELHRYNVARRERLDATSTSVARPEPLSEGRKRCRNQFVEAAQRTLRIARATR